MPCGGTSLTSSKPSTEAIAWGCVWTTDKINAIVLASKAAISLQAGPQTKEQETDTDA